MSSEINKTDREIEDDLLDVLAAAILYIQTKDTNPNPFVRKIGDAQDERAAFKILKDCVENASYLSPQIEELMEERLRLSQTENAVKED